MYAAKSVNGIPAIQHNGRNVLSVWGQDWDFAHEICELLNEQEKPEPALSLNEADRKWLTAIDRAFQVKVQHV